MSRINTNVTSLIAQRVLRKNNTAMATSLERLSTGLKINKGADNPAGLIASENLRAEKAGIVQAIKNAERASNVIGTAEGGLSEVSSLLTELQSLVNEAASTGGLSNEEVEANQLQVDSILNTINRIAQSTSFQGLKLLSEVLAKKEPGPASSINKMFWSEYVQRFTERMVNIRGAEAMLRGEPKSEEYATDRWTSSFLSNRSVTIWGGTAQV